MYDLPDLDPDDVDYSALGFVDVLDEPRTAPERRRTRVTGPSRRGRSAPQACAPSM